MKAKLIQCKEILVQYIDTIMYDFDAIEYLIDTIDYLLQGVLPCNTSILPIIIEDVMIASTYHKSKELLNVAGLLQSILEDLNKCTVSE